MFDRWKLFDLGTHLSLLVFLRIGVKKVEHRFTRGYVIFSISKKLANAWQKKSNAPLVRAALIYASSLLILIIFI